MYGLTRGTVTLISAALAGFLVWIATQISHTSNGGYWAVYGVIAGAGLVMALSQIFGGWTKWGWPRLSVNVFLIAFIPVLIAAGWVIVATQPDANWFRDHVNSWSGSIGIKNLVTDLSEYVGVLAFGIGLVFGFTFDTAGQAAGRQAATRRFGRRRRAAATPAAGATAPPTADRPTAREERETAIRNQEATRSDGEPVRSDRETVPSDRETVPSERPPTRSE